MERDKIRFVDDVTKMASLGDAAAEASALENPAGASAQERGAPVKRAKSETSSYYAKAASVFRSRGSRSQLSRSTSMTSSSRGWLGRVFASRSAVAINPASDVSGSSNGRNRTRPVGKCRSSDSIRDNVTSQRPASRRRYAPHSFHVCQIGEYYWVTFFAVFASFSVALLIQDVVLSSPL